MPELCLDFYLPGKDDPVGVLMWGKSPEQTDSDLAAGVARLGGMRPANYDQAYLLAANTLLRTPIETRTLDHHGLPIRCSPGTENYRSVSDCSRQCGERVAAIARVAAAGRTCARQSRHERR